MKGFKPCSHNSSTNCRRGIFGNFHLVIGIDFVIIIILLSLLSYLVSHSQQCTSLCTLEGQGCIFVLFLSGSITKKNYRLLKENCKRMMKPGVSVRPPYSQISEFYLSFKVHDFHNFKFTTKVHILQGA